MAVSGTSGAYYRAPTTYSTAVGLHATYTRHHFVKAASAAAIVPPAPYKIFSAFVGTSVQNPHHQSLWNHSSTLYKSSSNRRTTGTYNPAQMAGTPGTGAWYGWGATFDGTTVKNYWDGAQDGSATSSAGASRAVYVDLLAGMNSAGGLDASSQCSDMDAAEYAVWNVALTADEMAALAKGFRATRIRPQSLVFYAPLIRSPIDIRSGNTMNLVAGSEVIVDHPRVFG